MKQRNHLKLILLLAAFSAGAVGELRHLAANRLVAGGDVADAASTNVMFTAAGAAKAPVADGFRTAVLDSLHEPDPTRRAIAFGNSFSEWFQHDREAALDWLRQMPPGNEYTQGLFIALPAICKSDPQRALVLAASMATTHEQMAVYNVMFDQLAKDNLAAAAGWVQSVPAGEARENALRTVADNWNRNDSAGALDWAKNLEDAGERTSATESVLTMLAATDPQRAADLASQNLSGEALNRVLQKSLANLATVNPQAAADAVSKLPAGETQTATAIAVARALAAADPAAAIAWLQTLPAETQPVALNNTLDLWLQQDAGAAGKYVSELSAGSAQDAAVSHLAESWAEKDPAAAIAWAAGLSAGPAQNAAIISLTSGWARSDPAAAVRWTAELPADNAARSEALKGAYSYWEMADATAAATYLGGLSESDRNTIKPATVAAK
ncbi:MAG TPA: hypothetical protein VG347_18795 [Verrucomicrobiae bacterium]|nr:hypothetical protein [Verrucomicrobiae bacterium]